MAIEIQKFADKDGHYRRLPLSFREAISREPGARFPPVAGRYHLFVLYACPWAHRTLLTRALKGLTLIIGLTVVHWHMDDKGWRFATPEDKVPGTLAEPFYGFDRLRQLYFKANPEYAGRFTVPVLWDTVEETIVNNELLEIIRMLNTEFNGLVDAEHAAVDIYPADLHAQINELNDWIYPEINNGVYKAGFALTQEAYDQEVVGVFGGLDKVEAILSKTKYLTGDRLTEADIRLYPTIVRFDPVYVQHFKCNLGMIRTHYPAIHKWLRHLYWEVPGFKETTEFEHIKKHYTKSHPNINPYGITPQGPVPNIEKL